MATMYLRRAVAVGGQVVRVVFSEAPKTRSSAANNDGLNSANYSVSVTTGTASKPICIGTRGVILYPAFAVLNSGEVGIDLQTDRPLVVGLTYLLTISTRIVAANGDALGSPYSASFVGATRPMRQSQQIAKQGLIDFASGKSGLVVTNGDIATVTGVDSAKLRCLRRTTTVKNSFAYLPGYGVGFQPKTPVSVNRIGGLKADLSNQLKMEPDVQDAASNVQQDARGLTAVDLRIQTKQNQTFTYGVSAQNS